MKKPTVLTAADDSALRRRVRTLLQPRGYDVGEALSAVDVLRFAQHQRPDLIILGPVGSGAWDELYTAQQIRQADRRIPLILIPARSTEALAIAALRAGINDYFKLPVVFEELESSITRCLAGARSHASPPCDPHAHRPMPMPRMIGESLPMQRIKAYIGRVASTDSTVLITGESGTGKELVAEMIHRSSARHSKPLVGVNCAAIPDSLLESELFGYEKGAFTGANALKEGQLQLADGGTVFLDEIGDMSPYAQAKILRAVESKTVCRLGGKRSIPVDVRIIIAATNQDIERLVSAGRFRPDLYFRLNVGRIHLPPLRQRNEDLPGLLDHYRHALNRQFGLEVEGFTDEAWACLFRYHWPGNVREVKNVLEAMFINLIHQPSGKITFWDLPEPLRRPLSEVDHARQSERERVLSALLRTNWNMSQAAQQLSWSRMTLYRKLRKYHIVKSAPPARLSSSATSAAAPPVYVTRTAPPAPEAPRDGTPSCAANGSHRCVNHEV